MTHVEHLLSLIEEGEQLRDKMRQEMDAMRDIIQRQNETAKLQGAAIVKAEQAKKVYQTRMNMRDKNAVKMKRQVKHLQQQLTGSSTFNKRLKEYIKNINGGVFPHELWQKGD